ncbi:MAG: hypothetical protein HY512_01540 [Candidatus Aenigmarchaeota archaeon]|nr:hypothetical protein [Candidatus Aenigmarchaeota archaeon]
MKLVDPSGLVDRRFRTDCGLLVYMRWLGVEEELVYTNDAVYLKAGVGKPEERDPIATRDGKYWVLTGEERAFAGAHIGLKTGRQVMIDGKPREVFRKPGGSGFVIADDRLRMDTFFPAYVEMWKEATGRDTSPDNPLGFFYKDVDELTAEISRISGRPVVRNNFRSENPDVLHFPGEGSTRGYEKRNGGIVTNVKWLLYTYEGSKPLYDGLVRMLRKSFDRLPPHPRETKTPELHFFVDRKGIYEVEYQMEPQHTRLGFEPTKFSMKFGLSQRVPFPEPEHLSEANNFGVRHPNPLPESMKAIYRKILKEERKRGREEDLGTLFIDWPREATAMLAISGAEPNYIASMEETDALCIRNGVMLWGSRQTTPVHMFEPKYTFSNGELTMHFGVFDERAQSRVESWVMSADYEQLCGRRLMGIVD